ncbi:MAG: valine--tRNA ligase [Oscillospiraceae bacterium]|nr:valine--tRNA ligase [Oscillospiraceae bacterium]
MRELPTRYEPEKSEKRIYDMWMEKGCFRAARDPSKKPFTIVIPPPNVTGQLHLGHAFDETIQDVLIRYKRMQGYSALWLPGTDHAGISTQIKVEENLRVENLTRFDLGREKFTERVWDWKNKYGDRIVEQLKALGCSCDWDRERFTMDETCGKAVREVFVSLYEKGLIYKGNRIINRCPECATALSDTEVEHSEQPGHLWYIRYPVKDSQEFITIATTRPETMLGDTGVAVNPNDMRYSHIVGKSAILPLIGRELPIVADEYADPEFGSGCVKITPCHDPNDFEVGLRNDLEQVLIMDEKARIINSGKYDGMDRYEAREAVVRDLEESGYLVSVKEHSHSVGSCYRCGTVVEPVSSEQWFVKMQPLSREAARVVEDGTIRFVPDRFSKIYLNWMENCRDWCISRQLWWGHRIPAWYCEDCGHVTVSREDAAFCQKCKSGKIRQDPDVLDTWFSSALWPFSTLGWPDKTADLEYFYPTDVLVTGYDIIFFWVARMIFSGMEHMKKEPFKTVLIHGLIRDPQGKKMSKSAGNGIDPMEMIDRFGADALRFNIITGNSPGNDMRFYAERCEAMRNFANKLWNAARFVLLNLTIEKNELPLKPETEDKWILSKLNTLIKDITENLDKYELGIAADKINNFIWDSYCDWYIELTKPRLNGEDQEAKLSAQKVLLYVLTETLKLLHPFMPFITEEIYSALPNGGEALMTEEFPQYTDKYDFPEDEADFETIMSAVKALRSRRAEMNIPPSKKPRLIIVTDRKKVFADGASYLTKLAYAGSVEIADETPDDTSQTVSVATEGAVMYMPLAELVDFKKERERIEKELAKARHDLAGQRMKLSNDEFIKKAPERVINAEREKEAKLTALTENLEASLNGLAD